MKIRTDAAGMIYCSNLCTEIAQNMQAIEVSKKKFTDTDGDAVVVTVTEPERSRGVQSRQSLPRSSSGYGYLLYGRDYFYRCPARRTMWLIWWTLSHSMSGKQLTNQKYRSIGLGVSYHTPHAGKAQELSGKVKSITKFADILFETINYAAILASTNLAEERRKLFSFNGSDWQAAPTFEKKRLSFRKMACPAKGRTQGMRKCVSARRCTYQQHQYHLPGRLPDWILSCETLFSGREKGGMLPRVAPGCHRLLTGITKACPSDRSDLHGIRACGCARHIDGRKHEHLHHQWFHHYVRFSTCIWKHGKRRCKNHYYVPNKSLEVKNKESCSSWSE